MSALGGRLPTTRWHPAAGDVLERREGGGKGDPKAWPQKFLSLQGWIFNSEEFFLSGIGGWGRPALGGERGRVATACKIGWPGAGGGG